MTDIRTSRQGNKEEKGHSREGHYGHEPGQQEEGFKGGEGSKLCLRNLKKGAPGWLRH